MKFDKWLENLDQHNRARIYDLAVEHVSTSLERLQHLQNSVHEPTEEQLMTLRSIKADLMAAANLINNII